MQQVKIAIIGAGAVGSTLAYALLLKNIPAEIILIDTNQQRCTGEFLDLNDAVAFSSISSITKGSLIDANTADIVIIAAGARQEPGQSRTDLMSTNKKVVSSILSSISLMRSALLIMVTNPVDILTHYALELTKLPTHQVFGSGTLLDNQRLRILLSEKLNISAHSIHSYILGEHGDSQLVAWSQSTISGLPLMSFPGLSSTERARLAKQTQQEAYEIIKCKGATYYGVATCVAALCEDIIYHEKRVVPVSCLNKQYDICLSMPVVLGRNGIEQMLPLVLNKEEQAQFEKSALTIKESWQEFKKL